MSQAQGLLSYHDLVTLVDQGVIDGVEHDRINAASIDVTLANIILVEEAVPTSTRIVHLAGKESPKFRSVDITQLGWFMRPGSFLLASTRETFHLPNDISAEFKLKSSHARAGLQHALAGWCDAGWHGATLTLELKNQTQYHELLIEAGMPIGQMVFYRHAPVPADRSYASRGRYNRADSVCAAIVD